MLSFWAILVAAAAMAGRPDGQDALREAAARVREKVPAVEEAAGFSEPGVKAIFFEGPGWRGKPTRVFAWYGLPEGYQTGQKAPAMLLVHGGGGTAFASWVRLWNKHGYAALAIDTCGQLPRGKPWERDEQGGPPGWGGFDQVGEPVEDQWPYQAVMDVVLANSLLRAMSEVDPQRVGIVGISWGGYLTCIAAGLDPRFKFAIPVYGCGYLGEDSAWVKDFKQMGPEHAKEWLHAFDPAEYLSEAKMPILWVDGTNDSNYPLGSLRKSYLLPKGPRTLVTRVGMKHNHSAGWAPEEIYAFANAQCRGGTALAKVADAGIQDGTAWATYTSDSPIVKAELNYTTDSGEWKNRKWQTVDAAVETGSGKVTAKLPDGASAWFSNLIDERALVVSTEVARQ
jgi:dienelactone hydrolase